MKTAIMIQVTGAAVALFAITASATSARVQNQLLSKCGVDDKKHYYEVFQESVNDSDHAKAFDAARQYLACPGNADDPEVVLATLNLAVGRMLSERDSYRDAIPFLIKAVSYDSAIRTSPPAYYYLAYAYENGPYAELAALYKAKFEGKKESDQSKLALENIFQIVDRMIDAYARAVASVGVLPHAKGRSDLLREVTERGPGSPTDWMDALTVWYQFRHNSDVGLEEMIGKVLSQPLLTEPIPITSLPKRHR